MKKTILASLIFMLVFTMAGCTRKDAKTIDIYVEGYRYGFSLSKVAAAENGNTIVKILMSPLKNKEGETADLMTAMNVGALFLMETYIVVDDVPLEYNENSTFSIETNDDGMEFIYNYEFDTDQQPDEIYFYPAEKRNESDYHWQIDPATGEILKEAAITNQ